MLSIENGQCASGMTGYCFAPRTTSLPHSFRTELIMARSRLIGARFGKKDHRRVQASHTIRPQRPRRIGRFKCNGIEHWTYERIFASCRILHHAASCGIEPHARNGTGGMESVRLHCHPQHRPTRSGGCGHHRSGHRAPRAVDHCGAEAFENQRSDHPSFGKGEQAKRLFPSCCFADRR